MCERMSVQSVGDSCRHGENPCLAACAVLCGVVRHTELYGVGGGHGRMCERMSVQSVGLWAIHVVTVRLRALQRALFCAMW
jgi:hypothetical protein